MVKTLYFLRAAFCGFRQSPVIHLAAIMAIAVPLFLAGLARFAHTVLYLSLSSWGSEVELTLYLNEGAKPAAAKALVDRLKAEHGVDARVVVPAEALERLRKDLGEAGEVLSNLPRNPLPVSVEIRLPSLLQHTPEEIAGLAQQWAKLPSVESVGYGREWVERLESIGRAAKAVGAVVLVAVFSAAVVVVATTLQIVLFARRQEIEVQKLVGATDNFVKAPFLVEGLMQGFLGAIFAGACLWLLAHFWGQRIYQPAALAMGVLNLPSLIDSRALAQLCSAGSLLGLAGSFLAVHRFLRS